MTSSALGGKEILWISKALLIELYFCDCDIKIGIEKSTSDEVDSGGPYWTRTNDPRDVNTVLYHGDSCAWTTFFRRNPADFRYAPFQRTSIYL